jgi:hypothetical protein
MKCNPLAQALIQTPSKQNGRRVVNPGGHSGFYID